MKSIYAASALAGLIVGIVAAIIGVPIIIMSIMGFSLSTTLELLPFTITMHVGYNVIWGLVMGVLFARFYDVIPGESGVKKGLVWGLIYAIVPEWWVGSFALAYQTWQMALLWAIYGPVVIFFYGLPLGYLYEGIQKPVKTEDRRKLKPIATVIAGLVLSIVFAYFTFNNVKSGAPNTWNWPEFSPYTSMNAVAIDFVLWFIWGITFCILFVLLYARMPGKGIRKGIYWSLILCLITMIYGSSGGLLYYSAAYAPIVGQMAVGLIFVLPIYIGYGAILGYFYRKPTK